MRSIKAITLAVAAAIPLVMFSPGNASALNNEAMVSGTGSTLRAVFFEHANRTGKTITYHGGSSCSVTTADADYSAKKLPGSLWNSWNDDISSWRDYNSCDVNFYWDENFGGPQTGYLNGGAGRAVPSGWDNQASSFRVS